MRVTSLKARLGEPSTGERSTGGQTSSSHAVREMRSARVELSVTCCCEATSLTAGERSDTETVTLRSARGGWQRAFTRWCLARRLLNRVRPFSKETAFSLEFRRCDPSFPQVPVLATSVIRSHIRKETVIEEPYLSPTRRMNDKKMEMREPPVMLFLERITEVASTGMLSHQTT